MFELARQYKLAGMSAYSRLQEKEFSSEMQFGYEAVKHQRFVGTGYFDQVQQVISGGLASTVALAGSTETEQFGEKKTVSAGEMRRIPVEFAPDEMLLPSGD